MSHTDPHDRDPRVNPNPAPAGPPPIVQTKPDAPSESEPERKHHAFPPRIEIWDVRPKLS